MVGKVATKTMNKEKRYERKFYFPNKDEISLESIIKTNPYGFREIYHERQVNSIYYDTISFDNFWDNENGHENRAKLRIRWYGEKPEPNRDAFIEIKIKRGLVGSKIREKNEGELQAYIREMFKTTEPVLKVSYKRKYFESFDKKIRMTVDYKIKYQGLLKVSSINLPYEEIGGVIEIKYDISEDPIVSKITQMFDHRLEKFSKYARGIFACYY
jgi:SPX domain protein involved in polyphosphate accumulation